MVLVRRQHSHRAMRRAQLIPSVLLDAKLAALCKNRLSDFQCAELAVYAYRRTAAAQQPVFRVPEANEAAAAL